MSGDVLFGMEAFLQRMSYSTANKLSQSPCAAQPGYGKAENALGRRICGLIAHLFIGFQINLMLP
jgi:hypothetical protein